MRAVGLRCEHRHDIPCVDDPAPRLSWSLEATEPGRRQTAYRIRVTAMAQLWDSGRIASADTLDIAYAGKPLPSAAELTWAVQVWDEADGVSEWSEPARFRTGPSEWTAALDRARPAARPRHAGARHGGGSRRERLHDDPALAVPVPAADVRGREPGPSRDALRDGSRRARARAQRHTRRRRRAGARLDRFPRADRVRRARRHRPAARPARTCSARSSATGGTRASWAWTRAGPDNHYGRDPQLLCELHLERHDGSHEIVASDEQWSCSRGPIVYSDLLMGERYDAPARARPVAPRRHAGARRRPARPRACPADPRHRGAAAGRGRPARRRRPCRRPRAEHGRLGAAARRGRARHARAAPLRRDARARRVAAPGQPARRPPARHLRPGRRRRRGLGAALHVPRLPLRRGHGHRRLRAHGPRRAFRHAAAAAGSSAPTSSSTSSGGTSTGASAATSSRSRPTARSATSASAGSPTRRSSCRRRA